MKFFIDTANLEQIRKAHELGVLDGVTTNPSLMAKENIRGTENCNRHYVEICNIVEGDVSAEVIATDFEGMVREGESPGRRQASAHGPRAPHPLIRSPHNRKPDFRFGRKSGFFIKSQKTASRRDSLTRIY